MKNHFVISSVALALAALVALPVSAGLVVTADRSTAHYHVGETAKFVVSVAPDGAVAPTGKIAVAIFDAADKKVVDRTLDYAGVQTLDVPVVTDRPSFWRCVVSTACATNARPVTSMWGVACDPEKIRAGAPRPADFDAYWDGEIARLQREVPLDVKMTPRPTSADEPYEVYDVSFATFGGKRVFGLLSVPKDRAKGPFPVRVRVPGAGPGATSLKGSADAVLLVMNVHLFPTQTSAAEQQRLYREQDAAFKAKYGVTYALAGISVSREEYFYHDVILGINRAVDWVAAQTYADARDVVYFGSSQGGAFGYFLMGLNTHFRRGGMAVTAMCDHLAREDGRRPGWPNLVASQTTQEGRDRARKFAPYFDAVNFAPRIKVPVMSLAGFVDQTCHPATVWAAYNALGTREKMMIDGLGMPHSWAGRLWKSFDDWVAEKDGKASREIRALLVHLGHNMWCDWFPEGTDLARVDKRVGRPDTKLRCRDDIWRAVTDYAIAKKLNMLVIDVGEGLVYPTHPELAIEGSWSVAKLKAEIARLKAAGIECIPKLNFSTTHNGWLKHYRRLVGTPEYYRLVEDLLKDTCEVFGHPRFCHLGYDEERELYSPKFDFVVIRKAQAWERDFLHAVRACERIGMRPWIWSDYTWKHKDFLKRCPKSVIFSNWYYDENNLGYSLERNDSYDHERLENFYVLRDAGFDQIPCGTNWVGYRRRNGVGADDVIGRLVHFCRTEIPGEHLLGFMMAPWADMSSEAKRDFNTRGIDLFAEALGPTTTAPETLPPLVTDFDVRENSALTGKKAFYYCDDVIWLFRDLARERPQSLFDNAFMKLLKEAHDKYGFKVQLNCFYRTDYFYGSDEFTLAEMPDAYRAEWQANKDWIRLGFHSLQEFPDYPFINLSYKDTFAVVSKIKREIERFAGPGVFARGAVAHWGVVSKEACRAFADLGITMLCSHCGVRTAYTGDASVLPYGHAMRLEQNRKPETALFRRGSTDAAINSSIAGYNVLTEAQGKLMYGNFKYIYDRATGIGLKELEDYQPLAAGINLYTLASMKEAFKKVLGLQFVVYGHHEQYFYRDYLAYQSEYSAKVLEAARLLHANGYEFFFLEDLTAGECARSRK